MKITYVNGFIAFEHKGREFKSGIDTANNEIRINFIEVFKEENDSFVNIRNSSCFNLYEEVLKEIKKLIKQEV